MIIEHFIKNNIHYIKEIYDSGTVNIYPDPEFQPLSPEPTKPPLPDLNTTNKKLDFIIKELHLRNKYSY